MTQVRDLPWEVQAEICKMIEKYDLCKTAFEDTATYKLKWDLVVFVNDEPTQ